MTIEPRDYKLGRRAYEAFWNEQPQVWFDQLSHEFQMRWVRVGRAIDTELLALSRKHDPVKHKQKQNQSNWHKAVIPTANGQFKHKYAPEPNLTGLTPAEREFVMRPPKHRPKPNSRFDETTRERWRIAHRIGIVRKKKREAIAAMQARAAQRKKKTKPAKQAAKQQAEEKPNG